MIELTEDQRAAIERRYVLIFAVCAAVVAAVPALYAVMATPPGSSYLGFQFATDDQLVYAAWMRQAMGGQFLMDNRFTTDPQPGLTIHLYFFVLGQVARFTGIAVAMFLARMGLSAGFVFLAHRLIRKVTSDIFTTKLALALTVLGGGVGFLMWNNFGRQLVGGDPIANALSPLTSGWLPVDVWQPEGFVFPAMLTNGLFMASLCLIVYIFLAFLEAQESWKPVIGGAVAMAVLMNIHSYDVLLISLVMVGFLVMQIVRGDASAAWIMRALVIGLGALPPALWFVYVLRNDPVFQTRAETLTYSGTFRQLLAGYIIMVALGLVALARTQVNGSSASKRRIAGVAVVGLLIVGLYFAASGADPGQAFLSKAAWAGVFAAALVGLGLVATERPGANLIAAWAVVGLIAPYFPALFQRKLAMGLSIPWAVLAAIGLSILSAQRERYSRNLTTVLAILLISWTSARWMWRERILISNDVSNTTIHPVYIGKDVRNILAYLNDQPWGQRRVAIAPTGQPSTLADEEGKPLPDGYVSPYMPDLNPVLSGLTGVYTYAGHWSETPHAIERQRETAQVFSSRTPADVRAALLDRIHPDYIVAPVPSSFPELPLQDLSNLGEVVVDGTRYRLVRVQR